MSECTQTARERCRPKITDYHVCAASPPSLGESSTRRIGQRHRSREVGKSRKDARKWGNQVSVGCLTEPRSPPGLNHTAWGLYSPVESSSFLESFDLLNMVTSPRTLQSCLCSSVNDRATPKGQFTGSTSGLKARLDATLPIPLGRMLGTLMEGRGNGF